MISCGCTGLSGRWNYCLTRAGSAEPSSRDHSQPDPTKHSQSQAAPVGNNAWKDGCWGDDDDDDDEGEEERGRRERRHHITPPISAYVPVSTFCN